MITVSGNPNPTNPTNPTTKYRYEFDNLNCIFAFATFFDHNLLLVIADPPADRSRPFEGILPFYHVQYNLSTTFSQWNY